MARGEQILPQWNLLKTLQPRGAGIPLRRRAEEFEVGERTIQRDFEVLEELGFPVEHDEDEYGKRYGRMPHDFFKTGPLVLGLTEAVSLHFSPARRCNIHPAFTTAERLRQMEACDRLFTPKRRIRCDSPHMCRRTSAFIGEQDQPALGLAPRADLASPSGRSYGFRDNNRGRVSRAFGSFSQAEVGKAALRGPSGA